MSGATPGTCYSPLPHVAALMRATRSQRRHRPPFGLARKNEFVEPDQGDLGRPVPTPKIFQFSFDPNHFYIPRHPGPLEGRFAIVTNVGQGCGGRGCALGERREADGEVVWS